MLTLKELEYLSNKKFPYPGNEYAKLALESLKENIKLYEELYRGKNFDILFSDGKNLRFDIEDKFIPHMIGLDTKRIRETELGASCSAYQIIKNITENIEDTIKINEENGHTILNYFRIKVRSEIFKNFSNIFDMNFGCVRHDKKLSPNCDLMTMKSDNFLFIESNEVHAPYYMMGLAKNEKEELYIETLFPDTIPENMFLNQRIVIPTFMTVSNDSSYYKTFEPDSKEKLELLRKYKSQLANYTNNFDIFHDYETTLAKNGVNDAKKKIL